MLLEGQLKKCLHTGDYEKSVTLVKEIQGLFHPDKKNHRLLKAKLWGYEIALLANKNAQAAAGLEDFLNLANKGTKIRLEAQVLLAIACLRQKNRPRAQVLIKEVFDYVNDIESDSSRQLFIQKLTTRLEEECLLGELIGIKKPVFDLTDIHKQAVSLIQYKSDDEILALMGNSLPEQVRESVLKIHANAILLIKRDSDVKAISAGSENEKPKASGSRVVGVFKRVIWKSVVSVKPSPLWDSYEAGESWVIAYRYD